MPHSDEMWRFGLGSRIRRGVPSICVASRVVVTTSCRTEFSTVRLLSSGRTRAGRRRRGGSRGPHS
ncbi:hypothetical protein Taro_044995 [Colocasia esculenta]|uniref:Uncharacterized protein n=1 Tax=Colocasia esculenta TaxID=4460 RepID=A0A843WN98_COLES|nr:hypothetical protein [Colocasia esculenta]